MARLLLIDDDDHLCVYVKNFLEKRKIIVLIANSGNEGIKLFQKENPDLVLLDIKMADMNGLDVLKQIKQLDPKSHVIMLTIASNDENKQKAKELGADGFIRKPIDEENLEGTVGLAIAKIARERKKI